MDDGRWLAGLTGGQLTIGTIAIAASGGPIWAIALFGSLAAFGLISAVTGD